MLGTQQVVMSLSSPDVRGGPGFATANDSYHQDQWKMMNLGMGQKLLFSPVRM